jgi:exodeoxyribonuclease-3
VRVATLNLNGIRAADRKGLGAWMLALDADVIAFQEVRALPEQVPPTLLEWGHWQFFPAEKKGYSGVALWSKVPPDETVRGMGVESWDAEGRVITARWGETRVVSAYFPSGASSVARQQAKLDFLHDFQGWMEAGKFAEGKTALLGDFNICHTALDIHNPSRMWGIPGFNQEESAWMDQLAASGWVDAFRALHPQTAHAFTWWSTYGGARERNAGWRIDYAWLSPALAQNLQDSRHLPLALLSDHCPVRVEWRP